MIRSKEGMCLPAGISRLFQGELGRLVEIMQDRVKGKPVHVNLHHAAVPEEAEALKSDIQSKFNRVELYVTDFTPVMGVHTGPGTTALGFYSED